MNDYSKTPLYSFLLTLGQNVIGRTLTYKEDAKLNEIAYQSLPATEISYQLNTYAPDWDNMRYFNGMLHSMAYSWMRFEHWGNLKQQLNFCQRSMGYPLNMSM